MDFFKKPDKEIPSISADADDSKINLNEMTMKEIYNLLQNLPPDDKKQLISEWDKCQTLTLLSGVPFAGFIFGSSYLLRNKLNIAKVRFPIYACLGIGSMVMWGMAFGHKCSDEFKSKLVSIHQEYSSGERQMDNNEGSYENKSAAVDPYKFTPFISGTPPQHLADDNFSTVPTKP